MSKYYKAEDVYQFFEIGKYNLDLEELKADMENGLPTIDIVHCKDCRLATYFVKNAKTHETFYACPYSSIQHEGKFFCAYGERIDNE